MCIMPRRPARPAIGSRRWPPPSPRVRELIRAGAQLALAAPAEWLEEIDEATLKGSTAVVAGDPVLVAATRRTNRDNLLHWATANVRAPGEPVEPNLGKEPLAIARDLVRRGVGEAALDAYRTGQNAAWIRWMSIAFGLTSDPDELRELLDVTARSIAAFIDETIAAIGALIAAERAELTRGTHAERREVVALVVDGAPITEAVASRRLGYPLDDVHRAAVVWSDDPELSAASLESVANAFADAIGAERPLSVVATAASLWVWARSGEEPDLRRFGPAARAERAVRIAMGSPGQGMDGFRRSHLEALEAQRMVARIGSSQPIVSFEEVRLVSLATNDVEGAEQFVRNVLGDLESAEPLLRTSLLTFLREGCNAMATSKRLKTHRNTLLRRIARAEELLPRPLADSRIEVAVALEILRWRAGP